MKRTLTITLTAISIAILGTLILIQYRMGLFPAQLKQIRSECIREDYKRTQTPEWLYKTQTSAVTDWSTETCYKVYNQK